MHLSTPRDGFEVVERLFQVAPGHAICGFYWTHVCSHTQFIANVPDLKHSTNPTSCQSSPSQRSSMNKLRSEAGIAAYGFFFFFFFFWPSLL
jgi:hypothetical protein